MDKATAGSGDGYSVDILKVEGGPYGKLRLCTGTVDISAKFHMK